MLIKDILTIDLTEDIKNVIDLEDLSEIEIQSEIENYIITDGLAKEYADFVSIYTSNISETGVWISGFYGSGKTYFGKLLGYLLSNQSIAGTPARERILQRFTGITDEALVKNQISKLHTINSRVVFLDVAKQDTSKGLSFTLFRNMLKSLGFLENEYGYIEYSLLISNEYNEFLERVRQTTGKDWDILKKNVLEYGKAMKNALIGWKYSDNEYMDLRQTILRDIDHFGADRLRDHLRQYFEGFPNEKVVFMFDEASEAISQKKYNLLDLEGLSEALSSLGGKVWTMAIAQEKLDDVINNSNVSKAQLIKVTDRFKTKIHLEATEVDVIIRNRLLKKNDEATRSLETYFKNNSGKIADHSALYGTGIQKTEDSETYITYYPFYNYQFSLLQNFLFGTKGYASTKVAARGMIITTYDILKHQLQEEELFKTATGWQIAKEAQPQPQVRLVNRYDNAERILKQENHPISGRKLLETIYFLSESEVLPTTLTNIVKSFISDPEQFSTIQTQITTALDLLIDSKILLPTNGTYRITTDIEQRLLDEMNQYTVQGFVKKKRIVSAYKTSSSIKALAKINDSNIIYDFYITSDNDDELTNPGLKQLKLRAKSLYNISDDRSADIDLIKHQFQNDKDLIWLVPDNSSFSEIDKLIDDIERIIYLEDKYTNPQSDEAPIIRNFQTVKGEKEKRLQNLIEQSLQNAISIYLFNSSQLIKNNWQSILNGLQREVIQNVYYKRLASQLSDEVAGRVIKETNNNRLHTYFNGDDFKYFDQNGNFVGENLKPAAEILFKIRNTFVDGATLEKDLEQPPTGYGFGTVISTVAALMRGGKIMAKYNGEEKFSWKDEYVNDIFLKAREFRRASFKAIAKSLSAKQKDEIVKSLQDLKCEEFTDRKVDWNANDYDLVNSIRELAKRFVDKVDDMKKQQPEFDIMFGEIDNQYNILTNYTGLVSEANYIDKAETFLLNNNAYAKAVQAIERVEKFIRNNLPKLLEWKNFVKGVHDELIKAAKTNTMMSQLCVDFDTHYGKEMVKNFTSIQQIAQKIKDAYFNLMQNAANDMAAKYKQLKTDADALIKEITKLPPGLNDETSEKVTSLFQYASQRIQSKVELEYDIKEKHTRFTYSEMLSFIDLYNTKKTELEILQSGLIKTLPPKPTPGSPAKPVTKTFTSKLPAKKLKVSIYKQWLQKELHKLSGASDDDEIEFQDN